MQNPEFRTLGQLWRLERRININPYYFLTPVLLGLAGAAFEGMGLTLLIPLLQGFLQMDFSFIVEVPYLEHIIALLPDAMTTTDRMLFASLIGIFISATILKNIFRYTATVSMFYLSSRSQHHLRKHLFESYLRLEKAYFDQSTMGHHATVLSDFARKSMDPLMMINKVIQACFSLFIYAIILFSISWKLTLISLPLFLILHVSVRFVVKRIHALSKSLVISARDLGKKVIETISIMPLIHLSGTQNSERKQYTEISDQAARLEFHKVAIQHTVQPIQELITLFVGLGLFSGMLYLIVRQGQTPPPSFLVYFYIVLNASTKFTVISGFRGDLMSSAGPIDEVHHILDIANERNIPDGTQTFTGFSRSIEFRDLRFAYASGKVALSGASFTIEHDKMVAIVGATGAGKTTLVNILLRYYDCPPGSIVVDGTDLRSFTTASWLDRIAVVSQDTYLLNDSLRRNLTYGIRNASEEKVAKAIRMARLEEVVTRLPKGLDTEIGDRGVQLSGGEKQRVSIARALLKEADILILDEATSSLDVKTEAVIAEAIDDAIKGKTAIVIAHRLSTVRRADHVVVLEDGRCVEEGSVESLLKMKGRFASYWENQKFS